MIGDVEWWNGEGVVERSRGRGFGEVDHAREGGMPGTRAGGRMWQHGRRERLVEGGGGVTT